MARHGFAVIADANEACRRARRPGGMGVYVDAIARGMATAAGYLQYPHALGHQVGRHVHDGGTLLGPAWARYRNTPFMAAAESQVFTLEPSLSVPGLGAVGIEEDVVVTAQGARFLAPPQTELWTVK